MDVIRDSVIFNYIAFAFIIYFLKDELPYFKKRLFTLYKWYPLCMCCFFIISSYSPVLNETILFGGQRIFLYKFGDMGVHLFIASILLLNGYIVLSNRYLVIQWILIAYLFLIIASYSRSGMISFLIPMGAFFLLTQNKELKSQVYKLIKFAPLIILLAMPLFLSTNVEENFQGRTLSIEQLKNNAISIFATEDDGTTLSDNKVWRLVWWAKIIDYTFFGEFFLHGRGLGMSLADTDLENDLNEGNLRSPHNFHLTILARFGVPIFFFGFIGCFCILEKSEAKISVLSC